MNEFSEAAQLFRDMADRIEANKPDEFGGALVFVPPEGEDTDEPIAILIIDPARDPANFWSTVKARANLSADGFFARQDARERGYR